MLDDPKIHPSWQDFFKNEAEQDYFKNLSSFLKNEYAKAQIFPPRQQIFSAFHYDRSKIRVVILGQDPYHDEHQAHGLAFSVPDGIKPPPSLRNIFKELQNEIGKTPAESGNLTRWAKQGVFLLNNTLTVRAHQAGSHRGQDWESFTAKTIEYLNARNAHLVFLLWGGDARQKTKLIDQNKHLILTSAHPSPLSAYRGFFGNNHFKQCNEQLKKWNYTPINW